MSKSSNLPVQQFSASSARVKVVDIHPKEPLFIAALYTGSINLWNFETQALLKSFDTGTGLPVRCARFIPKLQSFVCGCDDMFVRVYNYNTMERTKIFQAHDDYIRSIAVHDHLPILLTASDDMTVRQWDWSKGWSLQMIYEGHMHYCMAVTFNPSDAATFATGSLDATIKVWSINNPTSNFQLEGHEDGVNCIEYYPRGDKPYLLSGSDDQTVRLWDYQTKACLQVFSFHTSNVTDVLFHPDLPLIFTVAEDFDMKVISSETFRLLHNVDHSQMQRAWSLAAKRYENNLVIGYDEGVVVFKVGDDKPVFSMDPNGRVLVATGNELSRIEIKGLPADTADGDILRLPSRDLGSVEAVASTVHHGPGGQCIALQGETDYTIVSTLALRPKTYGKCISFTWGPENGSYAVLEDSMTLKIYKSFKERATVSLLQSAEKVFGGPLLAVRGPRSVTFYDWATLSVIRMIDEAPNSVQWSTSGELVALSNEAAVFLLKFNSAEVADYLEQNGGTEADGIDFAFDLIEELDDKVRQLTWVGDCLVYINAANRLSYYIGGEVSSIAVLPRNVYLLGYLARENRIFCIDKEKNVTSYALRVEVIEYMAAVVREDFDRAAELLPSIDGGSRYKLAQFLEGRGLLGLALEVTNDDDHRFDLAVRLRKMAVVTQLVQQAPSPARWKQLGDIALEQAHFDVATRAFTECGDSSGLLLIYTATNNAKAISELGDRCLEAGKANVAFTCYHVARRHADVVCLLRRTGRFGEAAFYARTYCPEEIEECVSEWKASMASLPRVREAIASPSAYPNLFPALVTECLAKGPAAAAPVSASHTEPEAHPEEEHTTTTTTATTSTYHHHVDAAISPPAPHHNDAFGSAHPTEAAPAEDSAPAYQTPAGDLHQSPPLSASPDQPEPDTWAGADAHDAAAMPQTPVAEDAFAPAPPPPAITASVPASDPAAGLGDDDEWGN